MAIQFCRVLTPRGNTDWAVPELLTTAAVPDGTAETSSLRARMGVATYPCMAGKVISRFPKEHSQHRLMSTAVEQAPDQQDSPPPQRPWPRCLLASSTQRHASPHPDRKRGGGRSPRPRKRAGWGDGPWRRERRQTHIPHSAPPDPPNEGGPPLWPRTLVVAAGTTSNRHGWPATSATMMPPAPRSPALPNRAANVPPGPPHRPRWASSRSLPLQAQKIHDNAPIRNREWRPGWIPAGPRLRDGAPRGVEGPWKPFEAGSSTKGKQFVEGPEAVGLSRDQRGGSRTDRGNREGHVTRQPNPIGRRFRSLPGPRDNFRSSRNHLFLLRCRKTG